MFGRKGKSKQSVRRVRPFDAAVVALAAVSLAAVGPLGGPLGPFPAVRFLCALLLFLTPGALLTRWALAGLFPGAALVPAALATSVALFGFLGVPVLILQGSLEAYLWISGAVLAAFLAAAALRAVHGPPPEETAKGGAGGGAGRGLARFAFDPLWVPFAALGAALALVSRTRVPVAYEDAWVYLAWVREFLVADRLASHEPYFGAEIDGLSRAKINGWLLEEAALSRVSGIDPVDLVLGYLNPALVVVSLLAFYALARVLFGNERAALVAGCLCALFFLLNLGFSLFIPGGEFVARAAEDKFVARFVFLPVALALAVAYLRDGRRLSLAFFATLCWAVVAVHPVGLAIIGLSAAGFGVVHVLCNLSNRVAWGRTVALGAALLSVLLAPALYVAATGESPAGALKDADINSSDPEVLANMAFVRSDWKHLYELDGGLYIMHPSLLLNPAILTALVLGVPFLLWRLWRPGRPGALLAAQLLLGTLILSTFVCYAPPVATFVGNRVVLPGQLWRLAWPIQLAALLTLGWMAWALFERLGRALLGMGVRRVVAASLPLMVLAVVVVWTAPATAYGAWKVYNQSGAPPGRSYCKDPALHWMRDTLREPAVVLAPDAENTCIPAYAPEVDVLSLRGAAVLKRLPALERRAEGRIDVPPAARDVRKFYSPSTTRQERVGILHRNAPDYAMTRDDSTADTHMRRLPGLRPVEAPGGRYNFYAVDLRKLQAEGETP